MAPIDKAFESFFLRNHLVLISGELWAVLSTNANCSYQTELSSVDLLMHSLPRSSSCCGSNSQEDRIMELAQDTKAAAAAAAAAAGVMLV